MNFSPLLVSTALLALSLSARAEATSDKPTPQGPDVSLSQHRSEIVLNGIWKFQPDHDAAAPSKEEWGLIAVPGIWRSGGWAHGGGPMPGIIAKGKGAAWEQSEQEAHRAWYERTIEIPAAWAGRRILIDFQRVSTDAEVFINGKSCGRVAWPYGSVDITGAVEPGNAATLRVLVVTADQPEQSIVWMGTTAGQNEVVESTANGGITGEVFLRSEPMGAHVESVFVKPSVREKKVDLDLDLVDVREAGEVEVRARMINPATGEEEKTFEATILVNAAPEQTVSVSWPWSDPRLWDVGQPELYRLLVSVKGAGLEDEFAETFGFREFWIDGRDFYLNGKLFRPRPVLAEVLGRETFKEAEMDGRLRGFLGAGFNLVQLWPVDHFARGNAGAHRELFAERASTLGVPVIGVAASMNSSVYDSQYRLIWEEKRADWQARMQRDLKRFRNEPSIVMWGTSGNLFNHPGDQDPRNVGRRDFVPADKEQRQRPAGEEGLAAIRQADPTRPVFTHAGNRVGDVFTVNNYLNLIPLQEREEWFSEWAKTGDMPYLAIEFGNPVHCDMHRGRNSFGGAVTSEPWLTEFAAGFLGPDVYTNEGRAYRSAIQSRFDSGKAWLNWHDDRSPLRLDPNFQALQSHLMEGTWRAWRTWGVSGMLHWNLVDNSLFARRQLKSLETPFVPGMRGAWDGTLDPSQLSLFSPDGGWRALPAAETMTSLIRPELSWIAGPEDRFTDKTHIFRPEEKVEKSVVLINDGRKAKSYTGTWKIQAGETVWNSSVVEGELQPGEILYLPVSADVPKDAAGPGTITWQGKIGTADQKDEFSFVVLSPGTPAVPIRLWDPVGKTSQWLEARGIPFQNWDGETTTDLVVIGRESLSSADELPGDLKTFVENGGRLLVMAQDPDWLRRALGWRVSRFASRTVFPIPTAPESFSTIDPALLRDWRGAATLLDPRPRYDVTQIPTFGWRWGQSGVVASGAVEKPHHSGWTPLFEAEFDLAYSPLMELPFGRGRVLYSAFDVEDRDEPAAAEIFARIADYAANVPVAPRSEKTFFFGSDALAAWLDSTGVVYERAQKVPPIADLLIIEPDTSLDLSALEKLAEKGCRILVLPTPDGAATPVSTERKKGFAGTRGEIAAWPELQGLSVSDLRFRSDLPWTILNPADGLEVTADGLFARKALGKGTVLFTQLAPWSLPADEKTWLRFTRWRQTRALSQVLANLGATFQTDETFFAPRSDKDTPQIAGMWKMQMTQSFPSAKDPEIRTADPGISPQAKALVQTEADESQMRDVLLPALLPELDEADGEVVFRKEIELPESWAGRVLRLNLGILDDYDEVFFNGQRIGGMNISDPEPWATKRSYRVGAGIARAGKNVIAVRLFDDYDGGGFAGQPLDMSLSVVGEKKSEPKWYHTDYWEDFELGDEPYRYYRW